jgi:hypothetical protein
MRGARRIAVGLAAAAVLVPASTAGATVTIGSNLGRLPSIPFACGPCTAVQATLASDSAAAHGIVSPVNGTIFQWKIRSAGSGNTPAALRVVRPLSGGLFTGSGTSATVTPSPSATSAYRVELPITIGDKLGLDFQSGAIYFVNNPNGSRDSFEPPLSDGAPGRAPDSTFSSREVAINADIEPTSRFTAKAKAKRGGKVKVTAEVPNPGTLVAGDKSKRLTAAARKPPKLLKAITVQVAGPGQATVKVKATKAARSRLASRGKLKAGVKIVFTPLGGEAAARVIGVKLRP